jgi:hypothetical protein
VGFGGPERRKLQEADAEDGTQVVLVKLGGRVACRPLAKLQ